MNTIRYASGDSSLGRSCRPVLSWVSLGAFDAGLAELEAIPDANLEDRATLAETISIPAMIDHPEVTPAARRLQVSDFECRVWNALRGIPAGTTTTYGEIVARLGVPRQAREVGEACAANKLAVVVPCHRVVKKDGSISGYRWGVRRKRKLLEREHSARLLQPAVVLPNGMAAS